MRDRDRRPKHIVDADTTLGMSESGEVSDFVHQSANGLCGIKAQEIVLKMYGRFDVTEEQLAELSEMRGEFVPGDQGGSIPSEMGKVLRDEFHLPVSWSEGNNAYTLAAQLAKGHAVIVGVDSNELWYDYYEEQIKDAVEGVSANHAVLVSGIDTTDPDNVKVIVTDPGTGDVGKAYPLEQFLDAWSDSGRYMIHTNEPPPYTLKGIEELSSDFQESVSGRMLKSMMANFDHESGHIAEVCGVPFDRFDKDMTPDQFATELSERLDELSMRSGTSADIYSQSPPHEADSDSLLGTSFEVADSSEDSESGAEDDGSTELES